ncbi:MAG: hypothetical protein PVJ57_01935 [Phycisphaerae bacterium]|jgi:hypothetical protein
MKRTASIALLLVVSLSVFTTQAGLFEQIYYGLGILSTPTGSPISTGSDGTRVNGSRYGRLRIMPEGAGQGYSLEFNRVFGVDSFGRPEVLDLGAYELELSGSTQATLGYTTRGFFIGNAEIAASNINYSVRAKTGAQDAELTGTFNALGTLEVNQFGFYTLDLNVANSDAQLYLDGVLVSDDAETNYDIGPISVKGNVFLDAFIMLMDTFGADTTALEQLMPKSGIGTITDIINEDLLGPELLAGVQYTAGDGQLPPVSDVLGSGEDVLSASRAADAPAGPTSLVPEPGTVLLAAAAGALLWRWRRN